MSTIKDPEEDLRCGTYAGFMAHLHRGERACQPCKTARNDYMREWRLRTGRVKTIRVRPTAAQLALLRGAPDPQGRARGRQSANPRPAAAGVWMSTARIPDGTPLGLVQVGATIQRAQSTPGRSDTPVKPTSEVAHQPGQQPAANKRYCRACQVDVLWCPITGTECTCDDGCGPCVGG